MSSNTSKLHSESPIPSHIPRYLTIKKKSSSPSLSGEKELYPTQVYEHNQQETQTKSRNPDSNNKSTQGELRGKVQHVPCKFYKQGACTAGKTCIFSHEKPTNTQNMICQYFMKGKCKFGSKCALLHTSSLNPYRSMFDANQRDSRKSERAPATATKNVPINRLVDHDINTHTPFSSSDPNSIANQFGHMLNIRENTSHIYIAHQHSPFSGIGGFESPLRDNSRPMQFPNSFPLSSASTSGLSHSSNAYSFQEDKRAQEHIRDINNNTAAFTRSNHVNSSADRAWPSRQDVSTVTSQASKESLWSNMLNTKEWYPFGFENEHDLLPSSLDELLTPSELEMRKSKNSSMSSDSFLPSHRSTYHQNHNQNQNHDHQPQMFDFH